MHLLIPYAAHADPTCRQVWQGLQLPRLQHLLRHMRALPPTAWDAQAPVLPHEQLHAAEFGLLPRAPAWAALHAQQLALPNATEQAWAFVTPCHWQVGQAQVTLLAPEELALSAAESQALLTAMQPYFAEDGITLLYDSPTRWLAGGEVFRDLQASSLARALGRDVAPWLPASPTLRRLQNEMQMLLYTHAVNEARSARGALTVNSFWLSGSGALPSPLSPPQGAVTLVPDLMPAAQRGDWAGWGRAWEEIDATHLAPLLTALQQDTPQIQLTLCSEQGALRYVPASTGLWSRITRIFDPNPLSGIPDKL